MQWKLFHTPLLAGLLFWFCPIDRVANAGLGPENVVLVVNADSQDSRTIANHYAHLRSIPSRNIIVLDDVPDAMQIELAGFRELILKPLLQEIDARQLAPQTKAIVYSAGFPYAIGVRTHHAKLGASQEGISPTDLAGLKKVFTPTASINGLTYFYRYVLGDSEQYLAPGSNLYARASFQRYFDNPFLGDEAQVFNDAKQAAKEKKHEVAATSFTGLFEKYPTQHPIAIQAAQQYALAKMSDEAMEMLRQAVQAGWTSGRFLRTDPALVSLLAADGFVNLLESLEDAPIDYQPPIGFTQEGLWTRNGVTNRVADGHGTNYLMSMMLAVTRGKGTTVDQAIDYLTRSAQVDSTHPSGTFYFTNTKDVRSTTRMPSVQAATDYLDWLGQRSELVTSPIPLKRFDCIGVMFGTANYVWSASDSLILPGAIGDNLTSLGGYMAKAGQTKLTDFLVAGGAVSSGTVVEPYALQFKFPLPLMYPYYAAGTSAIEAFHLSVASPYQLLIVGDPLCQPFAKPPQHRIALGVGKGKAKGMLALQVSPASDPQAEEVAIEQIEVFINGKLVTRTPAKQNLLFKETDLGPGVHEIRLCLIAAGAVGARSGKVLVHTHQAIDTPTLEVVADEKELTFRVAGRNADRIELMHHQELAGTVTGNEGELKIEAGRFGKGPVRFQPVLIKGDQRIPGRVQVVQVK